ncbi:MAG: SGNH/GDSL hydrolase family protein [Cytophagales bacterium]|nr:MAG: SGNH/GDSL hydrolase family protein [Cytophagales bacterium]
MKDNFQIARIAVVGIVLFIILSIYSLSYYNPVIEKKINTEEKLAVKEVEKKVDSTEMIDTKPQRILLIGESMAQGLEIYLKKYAENNGHQFVSITQRSASMLLWVGKDSTGRLYNEIKKIQPTFVLISLGSNELFVKKEYLGEYDKYIQNIINQLNTTHFVWICPPNWKKDFGLTDLILEKTGKNRFFPSRDLEIPRAGDGIHPTMEGYELWTDKIAEWLMTKSKHKILMEKMIDNQKKVMDSTQKNN